MRICLGCGKKFSRPVNVSQRKWKKDWKFCSRKCYSLIARPIKICLVCGKEFRSWKHQGHKYCSVLCAGRSRPIRKEKIVLVCKFCGNQFTPIKRGKAGKKQAYCSKHCKDLAGSGVNHWNWKGGITKANHRRETKRYKEWRMEVYRRDKFRCQGCGKHCTQANIVAHHFKGWKEYPELRFIKDNGITLCRVCHRLKHKKTKDNEIV